MRNKKTKLELIQRLSSELNIDLIEAWNILKTANFNYNTATQLLSADPKNKLSKKKLSKLNLVKDHKKRSKWKIITTSIASIVTLGGFAVALYLSRNKKLKHISKDAPHKK